MDEFLLRALISGISIAIITGFLGCFIIWRKMAYFGDSLAHSSLLGISIALAFGLNINVSIIAIASIFAILLTYLQSKQIFSTDTLLGILAHGSLASALIIVSFIDDQEVDLHDFLFGDILSIDLSQLYLIISGAVIVYILLIKNWHKLILLTLNQDLAQSKNVSSFYLQLLLTFLTTITVAISIEIIGVLLISSLLIIPAASSRQVSSSPTQMAIISTIISLFAVIIGLLFSFFMQTPPGPSIVLVTSIIFIMTFIFSKNKYN